MDLTRTERLILETAAEMFDLGMSPSEASLMNILEVSDEEQVEANGERPQLGDLLVARGTLTADELAQVLDKVFDELHAWSDSLAAPEPVPVPKPVPRTNTGQLTLLVQQLTGLLDVLVGDAPMAAPTFKVQPLGDGTIVGVRRPAFRRAAGINLGENLLGIGPSTIVHEDEDEETGTRKISKKGEGEAHDDDEANTIHIERPPATPETGQTLQVERAEAARRDTLEVERASEDRPSTSSSSGGVRPPHPAEGDAGAPVRTRGPRP